MNETTPVADTADPADAPAPGPSYAVEIDASGLTATLRLEPLGAEVTVDLAQLVESVQSEHGLVDVDVDAIERAVDAARTEGVDPTGEVIATGEASVPGTDGHLEWLGDFFESHAITYPDGSVDHYHRTRCSVYEGQPLVRVHPPTEGHAGLDVQGKELVAARGKPVELQLDASVAPDPDHDDVRVAQRPGMVEFDRSRIAVCDVLEVDAVGWATGAVDFDGTVRIAQGVPARFEVRGGASVQIGGTVDQASVEAEGNLEIGGGVMGHGQARLTTGRDMVLSSVRDTEIHCGGRLVAERELLWCNGKVHEDLILQEGRIVGGDLRVGGTVFARELGSREEVTTIIRLGEDADRSRQLRRLQRERSRAQEQLQDHLRKHGHLLRDRADIALPEAEVEGHRKRLLALEAQARRAQRQELVLRGRLRARQTDSRIWVKQIVHPGVRVEFGDGHSRLLVRNEIAGPVCIHLSMQDEEIVVEKMDAPPQRRPVAS